MKATIFFFCILFSSLSYGGPIKINEVFPSPTAPEPEWIELFNNSEDSVNLGDYLIGDAKTLKPLFSATMIAGKSYALITKNNAELCAARDLPNGTLLIQIALPSLNNDADSIRLALKTDSSIEDIFLYKSSWGKKGASFERANFELPAISQANVVACEDLTGATPGRKNSCTKEPRKIPAQASLLVNEIMYDSEIEFIELFNASSDTLYLLDWNLCDMTTASPLTENVALPPDSLAVCAWDTAFFDKYPELSGSDRVIINPKKISLNNSGDGIIVRDFTGATQDSLNYKPDWHTSKGSAKEISLEKRGERLASAEKSSWGSSSEGATPLKTNSLKLDIGEGNLRADPKTFSAESPTKISFNLPAGMWSVSIKLYDISGRYICEIYRVRNSSGKEAFPWNGLGDGGARLSRGGYILLLDATDSISGHIISEKTLIAIGSSD